MFHTLLAFTLIVALGAPVFAQSVLIEEIARLTSPYVPADGSVAMPDGTIYGFASGGVERSSIWRAVPDGAGGYQATIVRDLTVADGSGPTRGFPHGHMAEAVELGPDGKIYFGGSTLARFDPVTNTIERLHDFGGARANSLTMGLDGHTLYGGTIGGQVFSFDSASGEYRSIGSYGNNMAAVVQMETGHLLLLHSHNFDSSNYQRLDPVTGVVDAHLQQAPVFVSLPMRGDDGKIYSAVHVPGSGLIGTDRLQRIDAACFCATVLANFTAPRGRLNGAAVKNGYFYFNDHLGTRRLNLSTLAVQPLSATRSSRLQISAGGTLLMFDGTHGSGPLGQSVMVDGSWRALNTNTFSPGVDSSALVVETMAPQGTDGLPERYTEGADGHLYGVGWNGARFAAIFQIDRATGTGALVQRLDLGGVMASHNAMTTRLVSATDGALYGTYMEWEQGNSGIFRFDPATNVAAIARQLSSGWDVGPDGGFPDRLSPGSDGWLYGGMGIGPNFGSDGSIFKFDPGSGAVVTLYHPADQFVFFNPGKLIEAEPGVWYGTAMNQVCGQLFRFDANTSTFTALANLTGAPCFVDGLARSADGRIFGARVDASLGNDVFFSFDPATSTLTTLPAPPASGFNIAEPDALAGADGQLYGTYVSVLRSEATMESLTQLVRIDPDSGAAAFVATLPPDAGVGKGFFTGSDGRFYIGTLDPWRVYAVAILDAIPVAPASGPFNGTTTLAATLKTAGTPLAGRTIAFTLNGAAIGSAITGADGVATLNNVSLSGIAVGTHANAIGASFAGDEHFPATTGTGSLTVVDVPTPGLVMGHGFIRTDDWKHEFAFVVAESAGGINRGAFELERKGKKSRDRFVALSLTSVWFGDEMVMFSGPATWNGQNGYRFEAVAVESAPGARGSLRITVYDQSDTAIFALDAQLDGGVILQK